MLPQLYAATQLRHWAPSTDFADEGVILIMNELFFSRRAEGGEQRGSVTPVRKTATSPVSSPQSFQKTLFSSSGSNNSAPKLLIIGPSKSGKTVLCHKLVIRILASKQVKRDFKIVPILIPVSRLVANYAKALEEADGDAVAGPSGSSPNSPTHDGDDAAKPEIDLIDAHFHEECSKFSRRYQALKKLQDSFKLLFIFDGMDEAGPMRDFVESYVDEKLRSRHQMVIVTAKQVRTAPSEENCETRGT